MTYIQECLEKFQELPSDIKEKIGGTETFNLIKELEKKYNVSLSFLVVLLAIGELDSEDIFDYVTAKYKLMPEVAENLGEEIETKILDPVFEELMRSEEAVKSASLSSVQEKELLLRIFSEKLVETFKNNKFADLQQLNIIIFKTFQADDLFEDKIINIFYNNQEVITLGKIILEGNEVRATIANWLKDFISENGSELFSTVTLAKYLSSNQNAKKLKEADRDLIRKLLKLYRNLVFFPESLEGIPIEKWKIFPIDSQPAPQLTKKLNDVLTETTTLVAPANKSSISRLATPGRPKTVSSSAPVVTPVVYPAPSESAELEEILNKYSPDSLEYKTIKQEIKRLKLKK